MTGEKAYEVGVLEELSVHIRGDNTRISLSCGDDHLIIRADADALQKLRVDVNGASLHIYSNEKTRSPVEIDAGITALRKLAVGCAAQCVGQGEFAGNHLEISLTGASGLRVAARYDDMEVLLSGASMAEIEGACDALRGILSGASRLKAEHLEAKQAAFTASGASRATLRVGEKLEAAASGASVIEYLGGESVRAETQASGASSVGRTATAL